MRHVLLVLLCAGCHEATAPVDTNDGGPGLPFSASLSTPAAFASNVESSAWPTLALENNRPCPRESFETAFAVRARGASSTLAGTFVWMYGATEQVAFMPNLPLADDGDYVVTLDATAACATGSPLRAGFSTGSHPRVSGVRLMSKEGTRVSGFVIDFSETMNADSVRDSVTVTSAEGVTGFTLEGDGGNSAELAFSLGGDVPVDSPLALTLGAAESATGVALDPSSWDSPTAIEGHWQLVVSSTLLSPGGAGQWDWHPTVNGP